MKEGLNRKERIRKNKRKRKKKGRKDKRGKKEKNERRIKEENMKKDVQNLKKTLRHISKFFVAVKCKLLFSLKRLPNSLSLINWARQSSETGIYLSLSYTFISLTASALNLSTAPPSTLPGRSTVIIPFLPKYISGRSSALRCSLGGKVDCSGALVEEKVEQQSAKSSYERLQVALEWGLLHMCH